MASQLPEFPVVMAMRGVDDTLGLRLMAEIGDVTRFAHRGAITSFAGVDPGANQSGTHEAKSGSPELRKALFLVMDCLIQTKPQDDPVYLFMDRKRAEGKPYWVYMTAGANKFLRIYYGRVREYLASLEKPSALDPGEHTCSFATFSFQADALVAVFFSCPLLSPHFFRFSANSLLTLYLQTVKYLLIQFAALNYD